MFLKNIITQSFILNLSLSHENFSLTIQKCFIIMLNRSRRSKELIVEYFREQNGTLIGRAFSKQNA